MSDVTVVFSGGGALGAWQVGALTRYVEENAHLNHRAYVGTSVGALNAGWLAQHTSIKQGVQELLHIWTHLNDSDVKRWTWLFHLNLLVRNYLYDSTPLRQIIEDSFDPKRVEEAGNELRLSVVEVGTPRLEIVDHRHPQIKDMIWASCCAPPFFEPVEIGGAWYQDGGVMQQTPLKDAISTETEKIVVFLTHPKQMVDPISINKLKRGPAYIGRAIATMMSEVWVRDLKSCYHINKSGRKRYVEVEVIAPPRNLEFDPFDFSNRPLCEMIDRGRSEYRVVGLEEFLYGETF